MDGVRKSWDNFAAHIGPGLLDVYFGVNQPLIHIGKWLDGPQETLFFWFSWNNTKKAEWDWNMYLYMNGSYV